MTSKKALNHVNRSELAGIFGISLPTVDVWVKQGCPIVKKGGTAGRAYVFDTAAVFRWRNDRAVEQATGETAVDLEVLNRRKILAQTQLAELELAEASGKVAPVADFERALAKQNAVIRQNIMTVPQRAVMMLIGEKDEIRFKSVLTAELREALERAAQSVIELDEAESDDDA